MELTYLQMLGRIEDLRQLSVPPLPGERSGACTSYDRRSRYDGEAGRYVDWDANDDGHGVMESLPDGGALAVHLKGPGVLWRSWSAMPGRGHIRVFADDLEQPIIDRPFIEYFTRFSEDFAPLNLPSLCPQLSRGFNSFLPIPFGKELRIEFAKGWGAYYHFTYTTFAPEVRVPRYADHFTVQGRRALAALDRRLYLRARRPEGLGKPTTLEKEVAPGGVEALWQAPGAGAIARLEVSFPEDQIALAPQALRDLVLDLYWDGEKSPSVSAPLGDFFASAPGLNTMYTLPCGMDEHRMYANWYMPFAKGAWAELRNLGGQAYRTRWTLFTEEGNPGGPLLRFHAKCHGDDFQGADEKRFLPGGDRYPDWPMLTVQNSAGRFCGLHLHIRDLWTYPTEKPEDWWFGYGGEERIDWWWGEGDEKFFVDGEDFPSTFGTGSEDYIGYAWAAEPPFAFFDSPFAAMSAMPLDGNGDTSVCRFHVCDNVPFTRRFEACLEKYKGNRWGEGNTCLFFPTAFWYQEAGTSDGYGGFKTKREG